MLSEEYYRSIIGDSNIMVSIYYLFYYTSNTLRKPDLNPTATMQSDVLEHMLTGVSFYIVNSFSISIVSEFQSFMEQSGLIVTILLVCLL